MHVWEPTKSVEFIVSADTSDGANPMAQFIQAIVTKNKLMAPVILLICAIGALIVHGSLFNVWLKLLFGAVGYARLSTRADAVSAGIRR